MIESKYGVKWHHIQAVHLAVAGGVFDGVFCCCLFSPPEVLDEIWDLIESVSEGFLTYSYIVMKIYIV